MKFTEYLGKTIQNKLSSNRVVVWYDKDRHFLEFVASLDIPNCNFVSADDSILVARRKAEELYRQIDDPAGNHSTKTANLLVYVPYGRHDSDSRQLDPFEVFAVAGTSFGDQESERLKPLAMKAMPEFTDQIERLFNEGSPTPEILDRLEQTPQYILVRQALGTTSSEEVAALLLGDKDSVERIKRVRGAVQEISRLLLEELGFRIPSSVPFTAVPDLLGRYVLFSEFCFDLTKDLPAALSNIPRASDLFRERIFSIANRLRTTITYQEAYLELAKKVEADLSLPSYFKENKLGSRDTFPFEEHASFAGFISAAEKDDFVLANQILKERKSSIWKLDPERALAWSVAEKCVRVLKKSEQVLSSWKQDAKTLNSVISAYTRPGGWNELDRAQRLMEQGASEIVNDDELRSLIAECRSKYRNAIDQIQRQFIKLIEETGWPPENMLRQSQVFDRFVTPLLSAREKVAYFLTDSLRYEMGQDLAQAIKGELGDVELYPACASLPTITTIGMASLLPNADGAITIRDDGAEVIPWLGTQPLPDVNARMGYMKQKLGDRFVDIEISEFLDQKSKTQLGMVKDKDLVVLRDTRIDRMGESVSSLEARRYMTDLLGDLKSAIRQIAKLGYQRIIIAADHGHVLLPRINPGDVAQNVSPGEWKMEKRRFRLGQQIKETPSTTVFKAEHLSIHGDVKEFVSPSGFGVFSAGTGYFHGGLSLQEAIIPVINFRAKVLQEIQAGGDLFEIHYRSNTFTSYVIGLKIWYASIVSQSTRVFVEVYSGSDKIGEAADCDARDPISHEITLIAGQETAVPVLINSEFKGDKIQIRVIDLDSPIILAGLELKNGILD
jgi:hypothetical protein